MSVDAAQAGRPSMFDALLRPFGDVHAGEGRNVALLFFNIFLLLVSYYVLKTVREPLILNSGGAELKSYAAAGQAALLVFYVPAYSWLASRLPVGRLVVVVLLFFLACIQLFFFAGLAGVPYLGLAFYIWVGIFSLTVIAQFWSFANDIYSKTEGDRLFPVIAIGATAGAPLGAFMAGHLFKAGVSVFTMMQIAAVLLGLHLLLYSTVGGHGAKKESQAKQKPGGGFTLVMQSKYLRLIALLLVLLNIVNTTGEYILGSLVTQDAVAHVAEAQRDAYVGGFYGDYFFYVNILSIVLQSLIVSRIVKVAGMAGILLALPVAALGAYGLVATAAGLSLVRWVKTAENAADYSFMNTAKQMLWLPTTREQKFKGKQAIDTFFVRFGDMLSAGVVFVGTNYLALRPQGFALANIVFVAVAFFVAFLVLRENRRLSAESPQH